MRSSERPREGQTRRRGRPPKAPCERWERLSLHIPIATYDAACRVALARGLTLSATIREVIVRQFP